MIEAINYCEETLRMTFEQFKTALLMVLATSFVSIAGFMAHSIWSLNEKMAVLVERMTYQDRDIVQIRRDVDTIRARLDK